MRRQLMLWGILVSCVVVWSGCSTRLGQFTAASSQNVRNLDYSSDNNTKRHVKGSTCLRFVFPIPFLFGHSDDRLQRAMDEAIRSGQNLGVDGDLLVNVRIDQGMVNLFVYYQDCVQIEGDLVKIKTTERILREK